MHIGQPSRTALATARVRAYHQIAAEPRVFTDPLAVRIAGISAAEPIDPGTATTQRHDADSAFQRRRRMFIAARHRFAEETVAAAVAAGTRQVVILGAGLDTFAYRNPHAEVRVFEVDHPDTQSWKRQRLAETGIAIPDSLTFAPVDFENRTLADGLAAAGFERGRPAAFVWLGVIMYLTGDSVRATLRFIADQALPVQVVFDYLYPPSSTTAEADAAQQARIDRVAAMGEPWITFFTADDIAHQLREIGFDDVEDFAGSALVAGYLNRPAAVPGGGAPPHLLRAARTASASARH